MNAQILQSLHIPFGDIELEADLVVPDAAWGTVLFAHGSGSSRHSPRNREVAAVLQQAGCATVLADLLTADEERVDVRTGQFRFDTELLGVRVAALVDWAVANPVTAGLRVGLFGASTGAAAALIAADQRPEEVAAVVSRGGRPDLAGDHLTSVLAPTQLIVGQRDHEVIELNRQAMARMKSEVEMVVVPGATHLFEEPGALQTVSELAAQWFIRYLAPRVP
ncbi:dienelactone hydrolase family protein [Lentzea albidocapillata]|uniref:Dienelactone hydrolase n=1 Tax=Lentzea albidocapillata TaxID=40571 RepID=A0A1W2FUF1_9PSEU|nr:alpha/beta family hydrolase [Lentzea albidocapillata]SMD25238.1 Dienelactone hydrolase [Lentzea albidocapillata]